MFLHGIHSIILILLFFWVQPSVLFAKSPILDKILADKVLTVSVNQFYEPFYIENPKETHPGLDVEIAQDFANFLGVNLKLVPLKDFDEHVRALKKNEVQISIAALSKNLERMKQVHFTEPYLTTSPAGLVNRLALPPEPEGQIVTVKSFRSLEDLASVSGISYSVRSYTNNFNYLKKRFPKAPIYSYLSNTTALGELKRNSITCFVADSFFIQATLLKTPSLRANFQPLLESVQEEHISMAVAKDDVEFLIILNDFIKEIKRNGRVAELTSKYFNSRAWIQKEEE